MENHPPHNVLMEQWLEQGFICSKTERLCYEWINWAMDYLNRPVRVTVGSPACAYCLETLYLACEKYLQEKQND